MQNQVKDGSNNLDSSSILRSGDEGKEVLVPETASPSGAADRNKGNPSPREKVVAYYTTVIAAFKSLPDPIKYQALPGIVLAAFFSPRLFYMVIMVIMGLVMGLFLATPAKSQEWQDRVDHVVNRVHSVKLYNFDAAALQEKAPPVSPKIDAELNKFLTNFVKDFIDSWFDPFNVSKSREFPTSVHTSVRFAFVKLGYSLAEMKLVTVVTAVTQTMIQHIKEYRTYESSTLPLDVYLARTPESPFHRHSNEQAIMQLLRNLSSHFLLSTLPQREQNSPAVLTFLREIIATSVFLPMVERFSDPDYVNQSLVGYLKKQIALAAEKEREKIDGGGGVAEVEVSGGGFSDRSSQVKSASTNASGDKLFIKVVEARRIPLSGSSSGIYCSLTFGKAVLKTRKVPAEAHPAWMEDFQFDWGDVETRGEGFDINIYDGRMIRDELIGSIFIPCASLKPNKFSKDWHFVDTSQCKFNTGAMTSELLLEIIVISTNINFDDDGSPIDARSPLDIAPPQPLLPTTVPETVVDELLPEVIPPQQSIETVEGVNEVVTYDGEPPADTDNSNLSEVQQPPTVSNLAGIEPAPVQTDADIPTDVPSSVMNSVEDPTTTMVSEPVSPTSVTTEDLDDPLVRILERLASPDFNYKKKETLALLCTDALSCPPGTFTDDCLNALADLASGTPLGSLGLTPKDVLDRVLVEAVESAHRHDNEMEGLGVNTPPLTPPKSKQSGESGNVPPPLPPRRRSKSYRKSIEIPILPPRPGSTALAPPLVPDEQPRGSYSAQKQSLVNEIAAVREQIMIIDMSVDVATNSNGARRNTSPSRQTGSPDASPTKVSRGLMETKMELMARVEGLLDALSELEAKELNDSRATQRNSVSSVSSQNNLITTLHGSTLRVVPDAVGSSQPLLKQTLLIIVEIPATGDGWAITKSAADFAKAHQRLSEDIIKVKKSPFPQSILPAAQRLNPVATPISPTQESLAQELEGWLNLMATDPVIARHSAFLDLLVPDTHRASTSQQTPTKSVRGQMLGALKSAGSVLRKAAVSTGNAAASVGGVAAAGISKMVQNTQGGTKEAPSAAVAAPATAKLERKPTGTSITPRVSSLKNKESNPEIRSEGEKYSMSVSKQRLLGIDTSDSAISKCRSSSPASSSRVVYDSSTNDAMVQPADVTPTPPPLPPRRTSSKGNLRVQEDKESVAEEQPRQKEEERKLTPAELSLILESVVGTLEEVLNLSDPQQWLKQRSLQVVKSLIRQTYSQTLADTLQTYIEDAMSEESVLGYLVSTRESMWPDTKEETSDQVGNESEKPPMSPTQARARTDEDKADTRIEAKRLMIENGITVFGLDSLQTVVGRQTIIAGLTRLLNMMQHRELNRGLVCRLLEAIIKSTL